MGEESPKATSAPTGAVFLSYASQDAEAAARICHALRAAGIGVFLDQSELRGGDVWDQKIRRQIRECALFVPLISANTASRHEGYFRLEWDLADQRSHMMARSRVFVLPVCLDATTEAAAEVPESFTRAQWTRFPAGEPPAAFVERVRGLLSPERPTTSRSPASAASLVSAAPAAFAPPPHSIAVLPFVNLSGDKEQEYFSDGLTEELLDSLSRINELQVAARTSSFFFKGKDVDLGTIARKLNVASVLEGSVRRSGRIIRITAQLNNSATGFHLWSQTYDRNVADVLQLQTEVAAAVANALKVTLLVGDVSSKIELGGTHDPAAFDAYLRGIKTASSSHNAKDVQTAIAAYTDAIGLDANYALAFARRSKAFTLYGDYLATRVEDRKSRFDQAYADAQRAIALEPDLAEGHLALGRYFAIGALDFARANDEYERALALAPGDAQVLREASGFAGNMGRADTSVAAARHAVMLDPLNQHAYLILGTVLFYARQYDEAIGAYQHILALDPDDLEASALIGFAYYN